ncbi:MAG: hypothetical protein JO131_02525 [Gammaproteobacteria bacterium]|nr:hypothetical protein [Gammaproteobacteria bacterium]
MKTRFPAHFDSLVDELKKLQPLKPAHWIENAGANNYFTPGTLPSTFVDQDRKLSHLPVAIIQPKLEEKTRSSCTAFHLLHEKSKQTFSFNDEEKSLPALDLTFIHTPLYYGETIKISKLGSCDINEYRYVVPIDIKEWFAQLTLAVYELHLHNLVHLDIKPENIFLFEYSGLAHLKLGDLDGLRHKDDQNTKVALTTSQLAPEICYQWKKLSSDAKQTLWDRQSDEYKIQFWRNLSIIGKNILWKNLSSLQQSQIYKKLTFPEQLLFLQSKKSFEKSKLYNTKKEIFWEKNSIFNMISSKKYHEAEKKALDCYALGLTFETIHLQSNLSAPHLNELILGLQHNNPNKRLTMQQVRQHVFFGETETERDTYFNTIKQKYKSTTFIDDYYVSTQYIPEQHDAFYILPLALKEIYLIASELNIQIHSIKQIPDNEHLRSDFTKLTFWKNERMHRTQGMFRRQSHFVRRKINEYYTDEHTLIAIQKKADNLKEKTELFLKNNNSMDIIKKLRAASEDIIYTIDELLNAYLASINNERLTDAVLNAEKTYCLKNKMLSSDSKNQSITYSKTSSNKNMSTLRDIDDFVKEIQLMTKTHSTRKLFLHILNYLEKNQENHTSSFETILTQELQSISKRPLNKWVKHLSISENKIDLHPKSYALKR